MSKACMLVVLADEDLMMIAWLEAVPDQEFSKVRWVPVATVVSGSVLAFLSLSQLEDSTIFSKGDKNRRDGSRSMRLREKLMLGRAGEDRDSSNPSSSLNNCTYLNHSLNSCLHSSFMDRVTGWIKNALFILFIYYMFFGGSGSSGPSLKH